MRAPIPSRLDFVPTVLNAIQWFGYLLWFSSRLGAAFMLLMTADKLAVIPEIAHRQTRATMSMW